MMCSDQWSGSTSHLSFLLKELTYVNQLTSHSNKLVKLNHRGCNVWHCWSSSSPYWPQICFFTQSTCSPFYLCILSPKQLSLFYRSIYSPIFPFPPPSQRSGLSGCQSALPTAAITIPPPTHPDIFWHTSEHREERHLTHSFICSFTHMLFCVAMTICCFCIKYSKDCTCSHNLVFIRNSTSRETPQLIVLCGLAACSKTEVKWAAEWKIICQHI